MKREGMLDAAYDAYIASCKQAGISTQNIVQTIGDAALSAGYHAADGQDEDGNDYTAAVDVSVLHPVHLSGAQVSALVLAMFHNGFCPFWRHQGVFMNGPHIHAVWVDCEMKPQLRGQVHDFLKARNGLVGHGLDTFWCHFIGQSAWDAGCQKLRTAFLAHNPATN